MPDTDRAPAAPRRWTAACAGIVSAGVALAVAELVCGLRDSGPSLVSAVGTEFIDRFAARRMVARAYAPYSQFPVGAAALVDDGRVVAGCNVENCAYGVTLCAECGLVSDLVASGGGRLVAFACRGGRDQVLMPCGRCRQLLWEHGGAELLVETSQGVQPLAVLLPAAFGPADLEAEPEGGAG